jgi:hypothetical protein
MTYEQAKAQRAAIERELSEASAAYAALGGGTGPSGLTPDTVKQSPEGRAAKGRIDSAFSRLRQINGYIVGKFPNELRAERRRTA